MDDKKWYNANYVNKMELVFSRFPQLSLNGDQFLVVLAIIWAQKANEIISLEYLCNQTKLNKETVNQILSALSQKGYLQIKTKNKKVEFILDKIFREEDDEELDNLDTNVFMLFEQEFGRALSHNELQMLIDLDKRYSKDEVVEALRSALIYDKRSLNYIAKILSNKHQEKKTDED